MDDHGLSIPIILLRLSAGPKKTNTVVLMQLLKNPKPRLIRKIDLHYRFSNKCIFSYLAKYCHYAYLSFFCFKLLYFQHSVI